MKSLLIVAALLVALSFVAKCFPRTEGSKGSGVGRLAVERWCKDQAAVYRNLRRLVLAGEIKNAEDVTRYFAFCRTKVEPNAAGPLGPEMGQIVGKKFDKDRIAAAAARLESEFEP
jgi:hypothetical protein